MTMTMKRMVPGLAASGLAFLLSGLAFALSHAAAPAPAPVAKDVTSKAVLEGLDNPAGVAIQPETGAVYVSNSGAGAIMRYDPKTGKSSAAVEGFKTDIYGKGPKYNIGPLGMVFLNKNTLAVGGGDQKDGEEVVYVFDLPEDNTTIKVDAGKKFGPIAGGDASKLGEGNFYGLAADDDAIYISSNGDDTKGWILKIALENGKPTKLEPFIATKPILEVDAPVGIMYMAKHNAIIVGQMGEINVPNDSLIAAFDKGGNIIAKAKTDLHDIVALGYNPADEKAYALDFAWMDTKQGGLFYLDSKHENDVLTITPKKILPLDKPTSLAFTADGTLYVTVIGTGEKKGQLLKIEGVSN